MFPRLPSGFLLGIALLVVMHGGAGCAHTHPSAPVSEAQREILAVTDAFFAALEARDSTALRALLHPEARVVMVQDGVHSSGGAAWSGAVGRMREPLVERIRNARVEVAGDLASLWAPYTFHIGTRFSHCGHDAFQYVRERGAWRLMAVSFTRQTTGCPAEGR